MVKIILKCCFLICYILYYINIIIAVQKIIESFVKDYCKFYSIYSMLLGVHELLHLVDCTKNYGSLNNINCFPFEELNRKVVGTIHGRDLIGE